MKVTMVNDMGNCFKIAETKEKIIELERLGFKKYEDPKGIIVTELKSEEKPKPKTSPKATTKKAVKKNG